ncbi:MAG TPA: peptidylprolyl isomerase [Candidatus Saccharimonadales bacterium]|nr:peptidylprolyl isomerase [Candidatus Saccharimonadales bacterium]
MKKKLNKLKRKLAKKDTAKTRTQEQGLPEVVTTDTLSEHREEVLSGGRKYIYPLQHSKHRIVLISTGIFISSMVVFFSYCTFALYKSKSTNGFLYIVTKVVPFPIAKAGSHFVAYENYLFELRRYMHFYENKQQLDFNSESGKAQLEQYKKRALDQVVNDAYVNELADKNNISISSRELDDQIEIARKQNLLGADEKGFENVLKDNFGWTINDFKRSLKQRLLAQKVVAVLDTDTQQRAKKALEELNKGADFDDIAKKYSDDRSTKNNGGEFNFLVSKNDINLAPQATVALFELKPGKISAIINSGYSLEILKNIKKEGNKVKAAHILFNFKDINTYINDLKDKEKTKLYVKL